MRIRVWTTLWLRLVLIWLWLQSPFVFLPIVPATIRFRIGQPIAPEALFPGVAPEEKELDAALERVTAEVQALMR